MTRVAALLTSFIHLVERMSSTTIPRPEPQEDDTICARVEEGSDGEPGPGRRRCRCARCRGRSSWPRPRSPCRPCGRSRRLPRRRRWSCRSARRRDAAVGEHRADELRRPLRVAFITSSTTSNGCRSVATSQRGCTTRGRTSRSPSAMRITSPLAHRLDVRRPLLDERHVDPGCGEVGADRRPVRAGAEHRHAQVGPHVGHAVLDRPGKHARTPGLQSH